MPLDKTFSIVENPDKQNSLMFKINNIKVNTEAVSEKIDIVDFLNYSDYISTGTFQSGGNTYRFYDLNAKANWIIDDSNRIYLSAFSGMGCS